MAFRNDGVQVQEYLYDFSVDGGAAGAIDLSAKAGYSPLPQGAIVKNVTFKVLDAVVGTSSTVAAGNTTDPDGYHVAIAEAALTADTVGAVGAQAGALLWNTAEDALIPFLVDSANDAVFSITIGTADLTAGKILYMVEYLMPSQD